MTYQPTQTVVSTARLRKVPRPPRHYLHNPHIHPITCQTSATHCRCVMSRMSRTAGEWPQVILPLSRNTGFLETCQSRVHVRQTNLQISTEYTRQLAVVLWLFALPRRRHPQHLFPSFISIARFEPPFHSAPSSFRHLYIFHAVHRCSFSALEET